MSWCEMTWPTADGILRRDSRGHGDFKAARRRRQRIYEHKGIDYEARPGARVYAPCAGTVRLGRAYSDSPQEDLLGIAPLAGIEVAVMYIRPLASLATGRHVEQGELIGHALSLQARYPGITDHIHLEIRLKGSRVANHALDEHVCVDPLLFMTGPPAGRSSDFQEAVNEGVVHNPAYDVPEDQQRRLHALWTRVGRLLKATIGGEA